MFKIYRLLSGCENLASARIAKNFGIEPGHALAAEVVRAPGRHFEGF